MEFESSEYGLVSVIEGKYENGLIALLIQDVYGEPIAKLTVNIPNHVESHIKSMIENDEFFVKTWSENEQIAKDALASGLFEDTGLWVPVSEYVSAQIWRMK
jgi:hypothetical protein